MAQNSGFLFHDSEKFFYGELSVKEIGVYSSVASELSREKQKKKKIYHNIAGVVATALMFISSAFGSEVTAPNIYTKKMQQINSWHIDDANLKKAFSEARKYLGMTQKGTASLLGLSKSAVEKIEQGIYNGISEKSKVVLKDFIEWVDLLKSNNKDKKFVVRTLIKTQSEWLDELTPLEYLKENSESGLEDLISLERKKSG